MLRADSYVDVPRTIRARSQCVWVGTVDVQKARADIQRQRLARAAAEHPAISPDGASSLKAPRDHSARATLGVKQPITARTCSCAHGFGISTIRRREAQ